MDEHALRELIDEVKAGRLSRRHFVRTMVGLGLTAPLAAQMLGARRERRRPSPSRWTSRRPGVAEADC